MRIAPLPALLALLVAGGCTSDPCTEYANYMCDCHPEEDCEDYQTIYGSGNADADLQESCAADLEDEQEEDGAEDYDLTGECGTEGEDTAA